MSNRVKLAIALTFLVGLPALAVSTKFSTFTPLTSSALPLAVDGPEEATPITLSNSKWSQRTVADRRTQNDLVPNSNSGAWDMVTSNTTGPDAGRYLFMPFETGTAGVQRVDLQNPHYDQRTVTIVAPGTQGFVSGDASRWTPWGGYLTGEESWGGNSTKGRLFEVKNPVTAGHNGGDFIVRTIVPRVAHEGLAFDKDNAMYFVDELNGGAVYKYVSTHPDAATGDEYFAAGQSFVLRVGAGGQFEGSNGPAITGAATWVAITNAMGGPIAGVSTVLADGTIDGRVSADDNDVRSTGYNRPEDVEISNEAPRPGGINIFRGRVRRPVFLGENVELEIDIRGEVLVSRQHSRLHFGAGDEIYVELPVERCVVVSGAAAGVGSRIHKAAGEHAGA